MSIALKQRAPDFCVNDLRGEAIQLSTAGIPVVLIFLRYLGCSICRDALAELTARHLDIANHGAEVWVFVPSSSEVLRAFTQPKRLPFRMFSDEPREIYALYGVDEDRFLLSTARQLSVASLVSAVRHTITHGHGFPEGTERQRIGAFVLDADGIVQYQYVASSILEELPIDALVQTLQALPPRRMTTLT
jgi:peroxiredoxin